MWNSRIARIALVFLWLFPAGSVGSVDRQNGGAKISIQMERQVIKGFPILVKLVARGPQVVPEFSIFDNGVNVDVFLDPIKGHTQYSIASGPQILLERGLLGQGGGLIDSVPCCETDVILSAGDERVMLLDLTSLLPALDAELPRTTAADIEPGTYKVRISLVSSGILSNETEITLMRPTVAEEQFLVSLGKLCRIRSSGRVDWAGYLRCCRDLPESALSGLRPQALNQLAFHLMLSEMLQSEKPSSVSLEAIRVPKYLRAEKNLMIHLFEQTNRNGNEPLAVAETLNQQPPGLKWWTDSMEKLLERWDCGRKQ